MVFEIKSRKLKNLKLKYNIIKNKVYNVVYLYLLNSQKNNLQ